MAKKMNVVKSPDWISVLIDGKVIFGNHSLDTSILSTFAKEFGITSYCEEYIEDEEEFFSRLEELEKPV